jgi:hypothetical protein
MISVSFDAPRVYCVGSAGITFPRKNPPSQSRRENVWVQHKLERAQAVIARQEPTTDFIS